MHSPKLTRRAALVGVVASTAAMSAAVIPAVSSAGDTCSLAIATVDQDADIVAAYEQWRAAYDALAQRPEGVEEDLDIDGPLYRAMAEAELRVLKQTPKTARGLAIQFATFTCFGDFGISASSLHDFEADIRALAAVEPPSAHPASRL